MLLSYLKLIIGTTISGTLGLFVTKIPLASAQIVMVRTFLGGSFLLLVSKLNKETVSKEVFKKNAPLMITSGIFFGISSILLFESYNYTTVGVATLTYYLAPVIVLILSPFVLYERLTFKKALGVGAALIGTFLVNGAASTGSNPKLGFLIALGSAITYSFVTLINKKITGVPPRILTYVQFYTMSVISAIYLAVTGDLFFTFPTGKELIYLLIVGVGHTGIALGMYVTSIQALPAQSVALISYIEPLSAVIFSSIVLGENMSFIQILGAVLIIGGAIFGEIGELIDSGLIRHVDSDE